jgi:hypothetical protein
MSKSEAVSAFRGLRFGALLVAALRGAGAVTVSAGTAFAAARFRPALAVVFFGSVMILSLQTA